MTSTNTGSGDEMSPRDALDEPLPGASLTGALNLGSLLGPVPVACRSMAQLDVSKLTGADAAVAIASYPRRFRSAFAWSPDEEVELAELASRIGPDGSSAHDHLVDAVSTLMVLGRAIHQVIHSDEPLLHPAVSDPTHRRWDPPPGMTVEDLLDLLESEVEAISAALRDLRSRDWDRTGRVADGPTVTALDLAREAVRTASEDLRAATVAMEAARKASAPPKSR